MGIIILQNSLNVPFRCHIFFYLLDPQQLLAFLL